VRPVFFNKAAGVILLFFLLGKASRAQDTLLYPSLPVGLQAPDFKGRSETGKTFSLLKVKSRYTLLYFYEVHCHLCELVTPQLKKLYDSYHEIGLEIVAVPSASSKEEWLSYIREQSLTWKNIFPDEHSQDSIKEDYQLTVSPTMYLLDRNKILLTQRLGRAEQVEEEINRRIR
jgi:peroxiredoxin